MRWRQVCIGSLCHWRDLSSLWTFFACMVLFMIDTTSTCRVEAAATCSNEFETCVMNRDCCGGLACVTGDWAITTDSTCLSERSVQLQALSRQEQLDLLVNFYTSDKIPADKHKSLQQVEILFNKNRRSFAKLVTRIETAYKTSMVGSIIPEKQPNDEL